MIDCGLHNVEFVLYWHESDSSFILSRRFAIKIAWWRHSQVWYKPAQATIYWMLSRARHYITLLKHTTIYYIARGNRLAKIVAINALIPCQFSLSTPLLYGQFLSEWQSNYPSRFPLVTSINDWWMNLKQLYSVDAILNPKIIPLQTDSRQW